MNEFWSWSVTVQNSRFSVSFYWKSINAEPETSRSRIDSFLQVLHWNVINSEPEMWLLVFKKSIEKYSIQRLRGVTVQNQYFSVRIVLKLKQFWAWGVIVQNRYFSIRIVSKMNEFWARGATVQMQCFSLRIAFNKDNQFRGWESWPSRILSYKSCIAIESILMLRRDCSESMPF